MEGLDDPVQAPSSGSEDRLQGHHMASSRLTSTQGKIARTALLVMGAGLALSACASLTPMPAGLASTGAATNDASVDRAGPRRAYNTSSAQGGPRYKVGAPYQAGGVWYVPAEQPNYEEVGLASWYGDEFNGKPTANGEIFDMNGVSAAHATLPMPSIVEVTNLENGRTIQVRMNDRGPFHPGRIIDMSRGAAQALGFLSKGTAQVRVRFIRAAPLTGVDAPVNTLASNRMHDVLPGSAPTPFASATPASAHPPTMSMAEATPSPQAGGYQVQAGAFSDRGNAERVAAQLGPAGHASIEAMDRAGGRLYRVTVGPWRTADDAGAARDKVAALGFAQARVISGS
jgi:rare lipoprotein A